MLAKASEVGSARINVSARDAAIGSGVTPPTASKGLNRLASNGWLVKGSKSYGKAVQWSVRVPINFTYSSLGETICVTKRQSNDAGHETWVRLGKAARSIWYSLDTEPKSARAIAKSAAVCPATADRQLPVLASYGLAQREWEGWRKGWADPDKVKADMGWLETNSKVQNRLDKIAQERWIQSLWRDERPPWEKEFPEPVKPLDPERYRRN